MLQIGLGGRVNTERVLAIMPTGSVQITRLIQDARQNKTLIEGNRGRRTQSVIVMDTGYVITSTITARTLAMRWNAEKLRRTIKDNLILGDDLETEGEEE